MLEAFRRRGGDVPEGTLDRRREAREDVVGGRAEIGGEIYPLKNWSPNGFCIGPTGLTPKPGDRLDVSFTIPLPERTLSFHCRTAVMRHDPESREIGGVFLNLPDHVQAVVEERFSIRAPKGYGLTLFEKLRAAIGMPPEPGDSGVGPVACAASEAGDDLVSEAAPAAPGGPGRAADDPPEDGAEAVQRYRDAAECGSADGQALLGLSYVVGEDVPQDYVRALMWLSLAAAQGHDEAAHGRDMIAGQMTAEQVAEAERLQREWLEKRHRMP